MVWEVTYCDLFLKSICDWSIAALIYRFPELPAVAAVCLLVTDSL